MSSKDDPFGSGGKTVIRPSPGGAPRPSPMPGRSGPAKPSPQSTVISPMPPLPDQSPRAPAPAHPAGGHIAPGPAHGIPKNETDNWMRGADPAKAFFPDKKAPEAPVGPVHKIPLEVALSARDGGQISAANPITSAAAPLLILLGRLRLMIIDMQAVPLMNHVAEEIRNFERKVSEAGVDAQDIEVAKYALCGTADDIVQNLPGTDRHVWMQYSMLAQFFQVRTSGVGFFEELNKVLANPAARYDLLELMHACLSLGFEGQYRGAAGGDVSLAAIRRDVYQALRRVRPRNDDDISPRWRGIAMAMRNSGFNIPVWVVGSVTAMALVGVFFLLRFLLSNDGTALSDQMLALHPSKQITIERASFEPLRVDNRDTTQLERIRGALSDQIDAGAMDVESVGEYIVISVNNLVLFPSGSAEVKKEFASVGQRIAEAMNNEPGPVNVVGHTDNVKLKGTGRFKSNYELSVARAQGVAKILSENLADPARIQVEGKGDLEPVADNKTREGRAKNRRVDISIPREETL